LVPAPYFKIGRSRRGTDRFSRPLLSTLRFASMDWRRLLILLALPALGCGTTRWTDTSRTATEQLLISDAIDRSVSRIDFHALQGQTVYLDTVFLNGVVDKEYLVSTLRQHMLASGCTLKPKKEEADFIVEARAGAVGTDRHDLLYGVPSFNLPWTPYTGGSAVVPEIALAKRTDQKGVAKVAVFAYHRTTGQPVWQSGTDMIASSAKNSWLFGMGPIQRGTIYDKAQFAGRDFHFPLFSRRATDEPPPVRVTRETTFNQPTKFAQRVSDPLAKFSESLAAPHDSKSEPLLPLADSGSDSSSQLGSSILSETSWPTNPIEASVETQASGALISSPSAPAPTDPTPMGRLIGIARRLDGSPVAPIK
jgi:hypothetical protein